MAPAPDQRPICSAGTARLSSRRQLRRSLGALVLVENRLTGLFHHRYRLFLARRQNVNTAGTKVEQLTLRVNAIEAGLDDVILFIRNN
jgi:hypothetical protein